MFSKPKIFTLMITENNPIFKLINKLHPKSSPGEYLGEWVPINNAQGHFTIKKDRKGARTTVLSLTIEELTNLLIFCLKHDPDKFTLQDQEIIKKLQNTNRNQKFRRDKPEGWVAHHVIPLSICERSKLVSKAIGYNIFNPDDPKGENKINLPASSHPGNHPKYCKEVESILDKQWWYIVEAGAEDNPQEIKECLTDIIDSLKQAILSLVDAGKTIEDF
jgi:A nuclease family of the HNH/ENDO VII superfamily with conserved AHH